MSHLHLIPGRPPLPEPPSLTEVLTKFDPTRLLQAMRLEGYRKSELAQELGVSTPAVGSWLVGTGKPTPIELRKLSELLKFPPQYFATGRPQAHLDTQEIFICTKSDSDN